MKSVLICSLFIAVTTLAAEKWKMTTLEWPPFTCEKCPDGGAGIKALKEALKAEGVDAEFVFLPWERAIAEAKTDKYVGYYPAWPEDVVEGFVGSDVIFKSPIGFAESVEKPIGTWSVLADLKGKTIGVVQGYGNTKEFMDLVKSGVIKSDSSVDDATVVKKVAAGRFPGGGGIIDVNVFKYFMQNDLKDQAGKVRMNAKILADKDLLVALKASDAKKNEILKKAVAKANTQKIVDEYLAKNLK